MRTARILRKAAVDDVWAQLKASGGADEFLRYADHILRDPENVLDLPFDTSELPELLITDDRAASEVYNAISIYEALGAMPKVAAADERLWTYLSLGPWRPYMTVRWPLSTSRSWKSRAQDRWLIKSATYGTLIRHGIARLWWLADMTFDPHMKRRLSSERGDEWAYLRIAVATEDRVLAIFDRDIGLIPELRFALLDLCAERGGAATEGWLRHLMKEITLAYGYRDLSALPPDELAEVLRELDDEEPMTSDT